MTRARHAEAQRIVVLVKRFPRPSETLILNEFLELRRQGLPVDLFAIMDPKERSTQPEALALVPEVTYLQTGRLRAELPAVWRAARRHPRGTLRAIGWTVTGTLARRRATCFTLSSCWIDWRTGRQRTCTPTCCIHLQRSRARAGPIRQRRNGSHLIALEGLAAHTRSG